LSYGLPNGGNITATIVMVLYDFAGNRVEAGRRTITFNNAGRTQPFGTIDNPAVGEVVAGNNFRNAGWAMTPSGSNPNKRVSNPSNLTECVQEGAPNYGRIQQQIDANTDINPLPCTYGGNRPDVQATFNGLGTFLDLPGVNIEMRFNTTSLTDGIHNVAWVIRDATGAVDGVGSRQFIVANAESGGGSDAPATDPNLLRDELVPTPTDPFALRKEALMFRTPRERVSFAETFLPEWEAPLADAKRMADGSWLVEVTAGKRLVLDLGQKVTGGELVSSIGRLPLPGGSTLKRELGTFLWMADGAYHGEYQLEFQRAGGAMSPVRVRVVVK
jgi:hypothetical protein